MTHEFDAVVVGSGSAGTAAALGLRARGRSVAVVDERPFGGTCVLRGCDPKKVLVAAARLVDDGQRYAALGIADVPALRWSALMRFKRTFTDPMPAKREQEYRDAGVVAMHGRATFADERTLRVGDDLVRAGHVVIAAGADPSHVVRGDEALLTSEQFLELEEMPPSLLFVGGGYIAFELAHVAARAGARATILHRGSMPLEGFDPDVVTRLVDVTRKVGIDVRLETEVLSVSREREGIVVHARAGADERTFEAAAGVLAAGRAPALEHLALDVAGVARTKRGVAVNEYLQSTTNPRVYAAGDAADGGGLPLTPVAGYEGELVAQNVAEGNRARVEMAGLASIVYTMPPLGTTGLSESRARESGREIDVRRGDMTDWYSTRHVAGRSAYYKVVLERGSRRILGASVLGPHAEEQINVLSLAIRQGLRAQDVTATLFGYPTGSSDFEYLLG